eukprot:c19379_g1_i11.p1 GENE.c19379_g1_i11~~c19379_g1_i11.p1  ORF type:complete len:120 (+),score=13.45 c19379_g1_i11:353-712(+)
MQFATHFARESRSASTRSCLDSSALATFNLGFFFLQELLQLKDDTIAYEDMVLRVLKYTVPIDTPHKYLLSLCSLLKGQNPSPLSRFLNTTKKKFHFQCREAWRLWPCPWPTICEQPSP